jgi:hypothetical protein
MLEASERGAITPYPIVAIVCTLKKEGVGE